MNKHTTLQCSAIPLALALHNFPNKAQKIQTKISQPHYTQKLKKIPRDRENSEPSSPLLLKLSVILLSQIRFHQLSVHTHTLLQPPQQLSFCSSHSQHSAKT